MRRDKHKFEKSKRRQEIKELKTLRSVISTISTHLFHGERLDHTQIGDEKRLNGLEGVGPVGLEGTDVAHFGRVQPHHRSGPEHE